MSSAVPPALEAPSSLRPVPGWIASGTAYSSENAAFRAGAALAHLHPVATGQVAGLPLALLRDRLALAAAEASIVRAGGRARAAELRDRTCFLALDARMDPESAQFALWRQAGTVVLRGDALLRLLAGDVADAVGCLRWPGTVGHAAREADTAGETRCGNRAPGDPTLEEEGGTADDPVVQAVRVLERFRDAPPDRWPFGLMQADAALARALGWPALLPLLSTGLARRDLLLEGAALRRACDGAIVREAIRAIRLASELERRAARLRAVAPKLRAKASEAAVALFLARDAIAPTMDLAPRIRGTRVPMSPRAAGRLCDRLVELGAVRELTGRGTFRLYGL